MRYLFILIFAAMSLTACSPNTPSSPSRIYTGNIVGLIGCWDERDTEHKTMQKGLVILTNDQDSLLTFILNVDSIINPQQRHYGTYSIPPIALPYNFSYIAIDSTDERYVKIAPIIDEMDHLPCKIPSLQVEIIPTK